MISEQDIKNWWECKIVNYLQNYAKRNIMTIAQAKEIFFVEMRDIFFEFVPQPLKKISNETTSRK